MRSRWQEARTIFPAVMGLILTTEFRSKRDGKD